MLRLTSPGFVLAAIAALVALGGCQSDPRCVLASDCGPGRVCVDGACQSDAAVSHPAPWPAALLRDGAELVIARVTPGGGIEVARSPDGITWTVVSTPVAAGARSPALGRTRAGLLLLAWSHSDLPDAPLDALPHDSSIHFAGSSNGGRLFSEPRRLPLLELAHAAPRGRMVTLSDGMLLLAADAWYGGTAVPPEQQGNFVVVLRSPDDGANWATPVVIGRGWQEPTLAAVADDQLLALVRDESGAVALASSNDRSEGWSAPAVVASADRRPADLVRLDDGAMLLTFTATCGGDALLNTALFSEDGTGFALPRRRIIGPAPVEPGPGTLSAAAPTGGALTITSLGASLDAAAAHRYTRDSLAESRCAEIRAARQLFLDEELVETGAGLEYRVHPPRKTGEVLLRADRPWEGLITANYPSVIAEPGRVRLWYEAYDLDYDIKADFGARLCYAESVNGGPFVKPDLGLLPYHGSNDNNVVFPTDDTWGHHGGTVFLDPVAPPEARYKLFAVSEDGIRLSTSPDGLRFKRHNSWSLNQSSDTQNVAYWDDELKRYVGFLRARDGGGGGTRTITRAESHDLLHFSTPRVVMRADAEDGMGVDLYSSAATKYQYASSAYLAFVSVFDYQRDTIVVQLAVSRDGTHYRRFRDPLWLPVGEPGSFDRLLLYQAPGVVRDGDGLASITPDSISTTMCPHPRFARRAPSAVPASAWTGSAPPTRRRTARSPPFRSPSPDRTCASTPPAGCAPRCSRPTERRSPASRSTTASPSRATTPTPSCAGRAPRWRRSAAAGSRCASS